MVNKWLLFWLFFAGIIICSKEAFTERLATFPFLVQIDFIQQNSTEVKLGILY